MYISISPPTGHILQSESLPTLAHHIENDTTGKTTKWIKNQRWTIIFFTFFLKHCVFITRMLQVRNQFNRNVFHFTVKYERIYSERDTDRNTLTNFFHY